MRKVQSPTNVRSGPRQRDPIQRPSEVINGIVILLALAIFFSTIIELLFLRCETDRYLLFQNRSHKVLLSQHDDGIDPYCLTTFRPLCYTQIAVCVLFVLVGGMGMVAAQKVVRNAVNSHLANSYRIVAVVVALFFCPILLMINAVQAIHFGHKQHTILFHVSLVQMVLVFIIAVLLIIGSTLYFCYRPEVKYWVIQNPSVHTLSPYRVTPNWAFTSRGAYYIPISHRLQRQRRRVQPRRLQPYAIVV